MEGPSKQFINIQDGTAQACDQDLGFEVSIYITSTLSTMTKVWYGELSIAAAVDNGTVSLVAPTIYARNISEWLGTSTFNTETPRLGPD